MRAIEVSEFGGPEVLRLVERPDPTPAPGELLVRVRAAAVNPSDVSARVGRTHQRVPDMPLPFVPGWDLAGEVLETRERVVGLIPWVPILARTGAYAELAVVEPAWLAPMPASLDWPLGAALPLSALTARQGLELLGLAPGARLLITGASGAVGGFAAQMAVAAGHAVIAVAGRDDLDWVRSLGVEAALPRDADLDTIEPVDGVFDGVPVGPRSAARLKPGGTAVFTRPPGADAPDGLRFELVSVRPDADALAEMVLDLAEGRLRIRIADALPLAQAPRAHARMDAGGVHGKLILLP